MAASLQSSTRRDIPVLPSRRLLAIDAGSQTLKLLLVEEIFGRVRVLQYERVELRPSGSAVEEEILRQAQSVVQELGGNPIALALPHYRALSQVVDLPAAEPADVKSAIEEETLKLSGLGESQIVHDYSPLRPFGRHENPYWVTLCQEAEIQRQIARCGLSHLDLCEVTTTANALVAAFQARRPDAERVVLVDIGAVGTLVSVLLGGQPVYITSFPLGTDSLSDVLATQRGCSAEEAERLRAAADLGADNVEPSLVEAWNRWLTELEHVIEEWIKENPLPELTPASFEYVLAGGGAAQRGLKEFLNRHQTLPFETWPEPEDAVFPEAAFAVAYGTAMHALGRAPHPASLLPDEVRLYWNRHHALQVLYSLLFFLLLLLAVALGIGTWQKIDVLGEKQALQTQGQLALAEARTTEMLSQRLVQDYEQVRPVLERQRETLGILQTLALLQHIRSNQAFYCVLFADQISYGAAPLWVATNPPPTAPTGTNAPAEAPPAASPPPAATSPFAAEIPFRPRDGYIVELCLPEQGDARRRMLSEIVGRMKLSPLYRNVDSLADDRRRRLVNPQVLLPEGSVALELEAADNPFERKDALTNRPPLTAVAEPRRTTRNDPNGAGRSTPGSTNR